MIKGKDRIELLEKKLMMGREKRRLEEKRREKQSATTLNTIFWPRLY
jgi:hypothetical protein